MAFPVSFFWHNKRENSTQIPTQSQILQGQTFNCTLLDNTSVMNPTLKISITPNINIWNEQWENGIYIWGTGKPSAEPNYIRTKTRISVLPSTTYYKKTQNRNTSFFFYDINDNFISPLAKGSDGTFTTPSNCYYMRFYVGLTSYTGDISINSPSTDTSYHKYSSLTTYNYCFIPEFERFYFINDITTDKNFWYVSCSCDVLATYKDQILSGSHYVLRSASSYDEYISDTAYIAKTGQTGTFQTFTNPFSYSSGHSYVWCITGDVINGTVENTQIGSNVYYWMDDAECYTFIDYLLDVQQWSGIQTLEYSYDMQKALLNPLQYVNAVILLPFGKDTTLSTNNQVKFGYYDVTLTGSPSPTVKRITQGTMIHTDTVDISIPKHPQATTYGKYMNGAPYTDYQLFLGPFGTIQLDPASLIDQTYITLTCNTEVATGKCQIFVRGKTSNVMLYTGTAQVGVPVTVSELTRDMLGEIQNNLNQGWSTAAAMSNIVTGGLGAAGSTMNAVQQIGGMAFDAVRLKYPTCQGGGSNGSFLSLHSSCYLDATFFTCTDRNTAELGRPLHQTKTLSTLSGFCLCQGAVAQITGTADEVNKINGYLNSGFFIE